MLPLFLCLVFTISPVAKAETDTMEKMEKAAMSPKVIALIYHADWCGSCKVLGPNVKEARAEAGLDGKEVVFVKMDFTDETTIAQSEMLARALGLGAAFEANNNKTGYMALFDAQSYEELGRIDKTMNSAAIATMINSKL